MSHRLHTPLKTAFRNPHERRRGLSLGGLFGLGEAPGPEKSFKKYIGRSAGNIRNEIPGNPAS
jgi:hypothetical protein